MTEPETAAHTTRCHRGHLYPEGCRCMPREAFESLPADVQAHLVGAGVEPLEVEDTRGVTYEETILRRVRAAEACS